MIVYISGTSSDNGKERVEWQFETVKNCLLDSGHAVVNEKEKYLLKHLPETDGYQYDMRLLASSEVLFLLNDWHKSLCARMEKAFAEATNKQIWFQDNLQEEDQEQKKTDALVMLVAEVIEEVTGMKRKEYSKTGRSRRLFFGRLLFTVNCYRLSLKAFQIAEAIGRDRTTVKHYLQKYKNEYQFNSVFRKAADRIEEKVNSRLSVV